VLAGEPSVGTLVLLQDAPRGLALQQAERYTRLVRAVGEGAAAAHTPLVVVSNLAVDFHPAFEAAARQAGAPCLRGTAERLFAVARFALGDLAARRLQRVVARRLIARSGLRGGF